MAYSQVEVCRSDKMYASPGVSLIEVNTGYMQVDVCRVGLLRCMHVICFYLAVDYFGFNFKLACI